MLAPVCQMGPHQQLHQLFIRGSLVAALQVVVAARKALVKALEQLLGQHPPTRVTRPWGLSLVLPGAGVVTAAACRGEMGKHRDALPCRMPRRCSLSVAPPP